nr:hypothetical protein Iba_chr12dCG5430 [Ipomoea batatas]
MLLHLITAFQVFIEHGKKESLNRSALGRPAAFRHNNGYIGTAGLLNGGVHGVEKRVEEVAVAGGIGVGLGEQSEGEGDLIGVISVAEIRVNVGEQREVVLGEELDDWALELVVENVEDDFDVGSPESVEDVGVGVVESQASDAIALVEVDRIGVGW